ncbi:hypothetical protein [Salinisphaera orenii]|uniref:hypothetical protein n=1 Tax=Salinisphaera orenii TaxID=856731 RepID=UPI000DBE4FB6
MVRLLLITILVLQPLAAVAVSHGDACVSHEHAPVADGQIHHHEKTGSAGVSAEKSENKLCCCDLAANCSPAAVAVVVPTTPDRIAHPTDVSRPVTQAVFAGFFRRLERPPAVNRRNPRLFILA